jgi:hypothetical protein
VVLLFQFVLWWSISHKVPYPSQIL